MIQDVPSLKKKQEYLAEQLDSIQTSKPTRICHLISCAVLTISSIAAATLGFFFLTNCIVCVSPSIACAVTIVCFALALTLLSCLLLQVEKARLHELHMSRIRTLALQFHFLASDYTYLVQSKSY